MGEAPGTLSWCGSASVHDTCSSLDAGKCRAPDTAHSIKSRQGSSGRGKGCSYRGTVLASVLEAPSTMVVHTCDPNTREVVAEDQNFKVGLKRWLSG